MKPMAKKERKNQKNSKKIKFDSIYLLVILTVTIFTILFVYSYIIRHNDAFEIKTELYDLSEECSLSLCDCKCYPSEELPEIVERKICGNDCYGLLGIQGCSMINGTCKVEYKQ